VAEPLNGPGGDSIEVMPVVVLSQIFPARPSSIPDIRDFVRRCLAESPLTEEGTREVGETVFRALLDAAGPTGCIQVAFRIFPEHVEVDVLHSDTPIAVPFQQVPADAAPPGRAALPAPRSAAPMDGTGDVGADQQPGWSAGPAGIRSPWAGQPDAARPDAGPGQTGSAAASTAPLESVPLGLPGHPATFAEWMSSALRREGLTQEAAARQLGVSVKTVSRWVGGATEPRMRDLRRIQQVFGEVPLP
jgi:DNA-binding XRE family transcriptional regulator